MPVQGTKKLILRLITNRRGVDFFLAYWVNRAMYSFAEGDPNDE